MTEIDYYFDPACPWTWMTSRWLVDAARQRGASVTWRPLSLKILNEHHPPNPYSALTDATFAALRVVTAIGDNAKVGDFYTVLGEHRHNAGEEFNQDLIVKAADEVGVVYALRGIDDPDAEAAVRLSTKEAMDLAGPDVGAPVIAFGDPRVGFHGPLVNPGPRGEAAGRLFDLVLGLGEFGDFLELKRGRRGDPQLPVR